MVLGAQNKKEGRIEVDGIKRITFPETPALPESKPEKPLETEQFFAGEGQVKSAEKLSEVTVAPAIVQSQAVQAKPADFLYNEVENVLSEGMSDIYLKLSPQVQKEFKKKGEETAGKINQLLKSTRVKVKKVFELIVAWLKIIPGVNRFFLEQEAKIRVSRLLALKSKKDRENLS